MEIPGLTERTESLIAIQSDVFNFIRRRTFSREDAEDLTQETLLAAWIGIHRFKDKSDLKTWIFSIAKNRVYDRIRRRTGIGTKGERERRLEWALSILQKPQFDSDYLATQIDCESILASLPEKDADLLRQFYLDGYTQKELGLLLGKSTNAIKMKLGRLRKKLRS